MSFYKGLAKMTEAKKLGIDVKEYERRLRLHKSGKYQNVHFIKKWPEKSRLPKSVANTNTITIE